MSKVRSAFALGSILALLSVSAPALGDDRSQAADQHFRVGVYAFQQGSWDIAVREFEAAFDASPHYAVLYNLGLAYAAQGRPAEAVEALERYLREGAARIPAERADSVRKTIEENRGQTGELLLDVSPEGADVAVDGRRRAADKPLVLSAGAHTISIEAAEKAPETRTIEIRPGQRSELRLSLKPKIAGASTDVAAFRVSCPVPDVDVSIDDKPLGQFVGVLPVTAGGHRLEFSRQGYAVDAHSLNVDRSAVADVVCSMRVAKDFPDGQKARLTIRPSRAGAAITVDGATFKNERLPLGTHRISAKCDDCIEWSRDVTLAAGETRSVSPELDLRPAARERLEREYTRRRTWTWMTGGAGIALGVTAGVLFAVNQGRTNDWNDEGAQLSANLSKQNPPSQELVVQSLNHDREALSIQRTADIALGTAIVGGALIGVATYLYFTTVPPPKSRSRASNPAFTPILAW